ncbi:septin-6-like [Cyprinus carpio]|uniref:Septin-6-like n=1 Tax=Cyprinus carpio TaxID=7962 RepID=A0A9R0A5N3_CYPCA|nr:septin-6-like [Cyprinus carpio]
MASSDVARQMDKNARPLALSGHVGFDSLPDQLVNKSTSQGFCFNILCIGETGIGKSTLMDTLFNTNFENFDHRPNFEAEGEVGERSHNDLQGESTSSPSSLMSRQTSPRGELHKFKIKIMSELCQARVQIYHFPLDRRDRSKITRQIERESLR